jgi:RNA polymerase sigma-70 factor (ECF subfamily)
MIYSLPERYREALILTEFDGLTQKELAERVGISLSGAKSRVQRGREMLKGMLHECCRFEFDRRGRVIECEPRAEDNCSECSRSPEDYENRERRAH